MEPRSISVYAVLWAALLSTSWLLPSFSPLWPSFDLEFAASISAGALLLGATVLLRGRWPMSRSAALVIACALVPLLQFAAGKIFFFGDAWLSALYLVGFGLAIMVGRQVSRFSDWPAALLLGIAIAGIASTAIAFQQWIGSTVLEDFTRAAPPDSRPFANIGQPNNLATLICLALISVWFARVIGRLHGSAAMGAATLLLFGLALTQSRTGWLIVGALLLAALRFREPLNSQRDWKWLGALATVFVAFVLVVAKVNERNKLAGPGLAERFAGGFRAAHWKAMLAAIASEPLTGWGWNQVSVAQQAVAPLLPPTPELLGYSHNIALDLLVWNGIPLGLLMIGAIVAWHVAAFRRVETATDALLYLAVVALSIHSLLEYPHAYSYFLLPVGLVIGTLEHRRNSVPFVELPRIAFVGIAALTLCGLAATATEYATARSNFDALRFARARIGTARNVPPPQLYLLTQLRALALVDRVKVGAGADASQIHLMRLTSERYPAVRTLMDYAVVVAGAGDNSAAHTSLVRLCKLYPQDACLEAARRWEDWANGPYPWLRGIVFPVEASNH